MIELAKGQIVFSKCGHDKNRVYIVVDILDNYLYLSDGKIRTLENPKKKKIKHVQITNYILSEIETKLQSNECTNDDLKKCIGDFKSKFNKEV